MVPPLRMHSDAPGFHARLLLTLMLALAAGPAAAMPEGALRLESHGPEDGLPQSTVGDLASDDQGFLWVATQDGLARFDGHRFQVWRDEVEAGDDAGAAGAGAGGLVSGSIDALLFDAARRRMWLGTNDVGLELVHLPSWSRTRFDRDSGLAHNQVTGFALDADGDAWVGTGAGLDHVDVDDATVTHLGGDAEVADLATLPGATAALALTRDCGLWHATRTMMHPLARLSAGDGDCIALRLGPEGAWVASEHAGLFLVDPGDGRVLRNLPRERLLPGAAPLTALLRRRDGSLLVGMRDGRIARLEGPAAAPGLLPLDRPLDNPVLVLHEDPTDALWIGTYTRGLHYVRPLSDVVRAGSSEAGAPGGWPRTSMRAVWADGGHLLLGTDSGLLERRPGSRDWRDVPGFAGQSVRAIIRAADGGWWIGSHDGLFHWRGATGAPPRPIAGLPDERVDKLLADGDTVWIGTRGGLARMVAGRIVDEPAYEALRHSQITALLRSGHHLWIATNADGLWRLDRDSPPERVHAEALHHSLWSLFAQDQALWVGSYSRGLYRIDVPTGEVTRLGTQQGLGNSVVYSLLGDDLGRVWASTNNGLSVVDADSESIQVLGPRDGLANREYNSSSGFRGADGLLYFGGTHGMDVLDPSALPRHSAPARPVLTTLRTVQLDAGGSGPRETDIVYAPSVRLGHRDRLVTIGMTAIDFSAADAAKLRYRVLGLHEDWVQPRSPTAEFSVTALPPGSYVLEVEAAGRDGRFGKPRRFAIAMAPPWWRHPLAYAAYALALLGLMVFVARRVDAAMRRERRQVELLEHTVAERTAELQLANQRLSRTNARLDIATRRDPLTRISNRRDLQEWLGREAAALRRRIETAGGSQDRLVFLMIDVDDFKRVNDLHGHQAGDEVLVHLADRLRLLSRDDDLLVRWGGEEFLLVTRFARVEDAALLAERIRSALADQPVRIGRGVSLALTCSIGFAPWPFSLEWPEVGDWSTSVDLADRCLYVVKRSGKDGWMGMVPGDAPRPEAIRTLLEGASAEDAGEGTVRVLRSPPPAADG